MTPPETRYARSGNVRIAYQVVDGNGPLDLVYVPGYVSNMDLSAPLAPARQKLPRTTFPFSGLHTGELR